MAEHDDRPPENVVPFGGVIGSAIAQQLNEFYGELVAEDRSSGALQTKQMSIGIAQQSAR
jgi:hypothetical protein